MAAWPASLPQVLMREGLSVARQPNRIAFQPEYGPPLVRKRGTSAPTSVAGAMILSEAQYATFTTFYETTTSYGAHTFTWVHPIDGSAVTMRFNAEPEYQPVGGGYWRLGLSLLVLP